MKTITAKQEARQEKKKKKMAALVEIIKLNDKDRKNNKYRQKNSSSSDIGSSSSSNSSDTNSDCVIEPSCKRLKVEHHNDQAQHANSDITNKSYKQKVNKISKSNVENADNDIKKKIKKKAIAIVEDTCVDNKLTHETLSSQAPVPLSETQYLQLKKELNDRKKALKSIPKLRLKLLGECASLEVDAKDRTPIFLTDIQHLLMVSLLGSSSPYTPWRWCHLEKGNKLSHTVVLFIEGLSLFHYSSYESIFQDCKKLFDVKLELVMPPNDDGLIIEELISVPLTNSQKEDLIKSYGSLEAAMEATQDPTLMMKTVFPLAASSSNSDKCNEKLPESDTFPRTQLLMSALQMVDQGYPLPLKGELSNRYKNYVMTKDVYTEVTPNSPMFGLDCEMVKTNYGNSELVRISIVNEKLESIYEELVKPEHKIIDYMTVFSGVTPELMSKVKKTLKEVQEDVRNLLPSDAILVGQSLNSDFTAMKMMHPYVIDTSVIFNITGQRGRKSKLQTLALRFLNEEIQMNPEGHDSTEDSAASLKLAQLKLSKSIDFGDAVLMGHKRSNENYRNLTGIVTTEKEPVKECTGNLIGHILKKDRSTAIINSSETNVDYKKYINRIKNFNECGDVKQNYDNLNAKINCYQQDNNKMAILKACEVVCEHALTITHLKILPQRLELSRIEKTLSNVDKWVSKVWDNVSHNGMFIVILGGTPGGTSGVALIKIKKADASDALLTT